MARKTITTTAKAAIDAKGQRTDSVTRVERIAPRPARRGRSVELESVGGGGSVFVLMTGAVLITVVRTIAAPANDDESRGASVSRIIIGGAMATGLLLVAEQAAPKLTRGFAAVVFLTAVMVHGVTFLQALNKASDRPNKPS